MQLFRSCERVFGRAIEGKPFSFGLAENVIYNKKEKLNMDMVSYDYLEKFQKNNQILQSEKRTKVSLLVMTLDAFQVSNGATCALV